MSKLNKVIDELIIMWEAQSEINRINVIRLERLEAELEATRSTQGTTN